MDILSWILFGLIAALVITIIDRNAPSSEGILGAILVGIVGAVVGGLTGSIIFGGEDLGFNLVSFGIAAAGALFLLILQRGLKRI